MASSLKAQLAQIATNSTNSLNLKAQKASHSKSLIFEPRVAASQSFDTLYTLCHEGFQELCLLDGRFLEFQKTIFSEQSQTVDRTQLPVAEISELDKRLEAFLGLVGGRLRLNPAIKAVEWLVRRFRIHEYNTSFLLTTFLPYHTLPIFTTLLSIIPSKIPAEYQFLAPYVRSLTQPQRRPIVTAATDSTIFASTLNAYVLRVCKARQHYPAIIAFWAGIMTEATSNMLDKARSGRRGVQQQNEQDVIMRLLPTLNEGLSMQKVPDLRIGCYMILSILASKGGLDDKLLTAMMEALVLGWTNETVRPGLVCLSILAQHRGAKQITRRVTKELLKVPDLATQLIELGKERRIDRLSNGLCLALVDRISKSGEVQGLPTIEQIVEHGLLSDAQTSVVVKHLLLVAHRVDDATDSEKSTRAHLASSLVALTQLSGHVGTVIQGALKETDVDMDELELKLSATIRRIETAKEEDEDVVMGDDDAKTESRPDFRQLIEKLPQSSSKETSFLMHGASRIYQDLCQAFLVAAVNAGDLDIFDELPILNRASALEKTLYLTFYIRIWCGPYPVMARVSALHLVARYLSGHENAGVDIQGIIPYAISALADPAPKVRRAAAELILKIETFYPAGAITKKSSSSRQQWAFDDIYGPGEETQETKWLSIDNATRLLREVLVPALEECVLDKTHIESVVEQSLNSPRASAESNKKSDARLTQTARASILSFLSSHVIHTPVYSAKLRLLVILNHVRSIASTTRTKVLLPVLQQWASLSPEVALQHSNDEQFAMADFDKQAAATVVANDKEGLQFFTQIVHGEIASNRPTLLEAIFARLREMWTSLKGDVQLQTAQMLMDASQSSSEGSTKSAEEALELLRNAPLSTEILLSFLDQLPTTAKLTDAPPASKRRRTSHGEVARTSLQDPKQLAAAIRQVTFVLQLIDTSDPGNHPELLKGLFNTLAELQHFKVQVSSELAYLQDLVLNSLLSILKAHKANPEMELDHSDIRADLLVDCVQKTASPQVQNGALLMIAALADIAPEVVLHSVMPIFTFMGSSVLRQNDDYSAHVISQTIREVIPPLITSLRKDKGNPVTGAAELLLSFVAAYEHIPVHRRKGLFISLVQTLGAEDFLFALLIMLVDKYGVNDDIKSFSAELTNAFSVEVQLQSAIKYLELIDDLLAPKPTFSLILLGAHEEIDPQRAALHELTLLPHILSQRRLITQTAKLLDRDDMDAARIRELYSTLLENLKHFGSPFHKRVCQISRGLLDRPNEDLRRKILRSLQVRIDQESASDAVSRVAMLGFLPQLTSIIRESTDMPYKRTAVACVEKISEKYGKKDLEAVSAAAETIASNHCLGQSDTGLQIMALLSLASLVEILREGIVSVLPVAIPKALEYIKSSIEDTVEAQKLHNAGYTFISALVQHLPYMITGGYLDTLLSISNNSAEAELEDEADEIRENCLHLAAKRVDAKSMFFALEKNWAQAVTAGTWAIREQLEMLSMSIKAHPKSVVSKHSSILAKIFQNAFDLRRQLSNADDYDQSDETISEIEGQVNEVALEMIYKFNDSTFRPIFSNLVEWASSSLPKKDKSGRNLRLQSVYGFMAVFFGNLKSIVTSYATYLLDNAVQILKETDIKNDASRELWTRVLRALVPCFEHDQDDFWQSPAHFKAIAHVLRLLIHNVEEAPKIKAPITSSAANAPRKPLMVVKNPVEATQAPTPSENPSSIDGYYLVLWRKFTMKKHKTWDGDGILAVTGGYARLQNIDGRDMGRCIRTTSASSNPIKYIEKQFYEHTWKRKDSGLGSAIPAKTFYASTPKSDAVKSQFKNPLLATTVMPQNKSGTPTPRHDPSVPGAIVMQRPNPKYVAKGKQVVDVVVDPFLGRHLRDHQKEGVKFLYECVMGYRSFNGQGAILADEMGLGKTLQTIALLWTLLKQNPEHPHEGGVIKKALIVCPVTLISNWKAEFNKWLGNERIGVFVADGSKNIRLTDFTHGKSYSVMIIGYEKLRTVQEELKKGSGIDIVVADEGHRLKTAANKSAQAIKNLNTERRVILSGTPIQNDLSEFFTMVDFVNPGLLNGYNTFKKCFEAPILKSRQPGATESDMEKGTAREEELAELTKLFILRRNASILAKYLKPKTEYVLFCKPTQAQAEVYQHVLASPVFGRVLGSSEASLQLITMLKKVCNAPSLLVKRDLVNTFNKTPASKYFAFLLSAKSGGAGINLIGASRLVLFDVDWNPATDLQAMARIHRDGQKRPVKIYRFLMSGGMDEKIYQRQVTKMGLADSVMDGKKNEASFSADELRDLFRLDVNAQCQTHELLGCDCGGVGREEPVVSASEMPEPNKEISASEEDEEDDDDEFPINPACSLMYDDDADDAAGVELLGRP
ncbi:ssu processome component [Botrytis cinerea]